MNPNQYTLKALLAGLLALGILQGCGSGSGAATSENPVTVSPDVSNYNGPPPATPDVQAFKLALWDNLVPNNRCGTCHSNDQTPRFVRADDINLAYDVANGIVNLSDPGDSLLVTKVAGGHNCWLPEDSACADIIESYIENWAGDSLGGAGKEIELEAPPIRDPGSSRNFPDDSSLFASTVHPLLVDYCAGCHQEAAAIPQAPYFAGPDVEAAYDAAKAKINLDQPADSRFVLRLRNEFHNCWSGTCANDANTMEAQIQAMADGIAPTEVDPDLVTSKALGLTDGIVSSAGGRFESNVIALYEFKTGSGNQAFDTSGVEPSLNLTLSGAYDWVGGWGVAFTGGKAQGSTTASAKLYDLITSTGEFSLEAWVAPGNVTQDGPARIITYSGGGNNRNFMLGQTLYDYDSFVRSDETDQSGEPQLSTPSADEVLQATLQHVVLNYDPINGRRIYVNGQLIDAVDSVPGGLLNEWDDTFAFAIGSEVDNQNGWTGVIRLLAVHNRVLTPEQITQNFEIGVGEKYYLLFNVSDHIDVPDAYVVFEVSQFDSYAYLFDAPFFVVLNDAGVTLGEIPMAGMRIGINGREARVGQAYQNLDVTLNDVDYAENGFQVLSELGTTVTLEQGPEEDEFFLTFEVLGDATNVVVEPDPVPSVRPPGLRTDPDVGIRTFSEINATMSSMTGVPATQPGVRATYETVYQAMPVQPKIAGFISSQQMGVTQLAIQYCNALVDDPALRAAFWPSFDFDAPLATAFDDRSAVIDPLYANVAGSGLATQPNSSEFAAEMNSLIDGLTNCGGSCEADRVERVMKGACAAALGSAVMLVQ